VAKCFEWKILNWLQKFPEHLELCWLHCSRLRGWKLGGLLNNRITGCHSELRYIKRIIGKSGAPYTFVPNSGLYFIEKLELIYVIQTKVIIQRFPQHCKANKHGNVQFSKELIILFHYQFSFCNRNFEYFQRFAFKFCGWTVWELVMFVLKKSQQLSRNRQPLQTIALNPPQSLAIW
jgi:hypothetical protein